MLVLPVTKQEEKDLTPPAPPEKYQHHVNDYVNFRAETKDKEAAARIGNREHLFKNTACYAALRPNFDKYSITCLPLAKGATTLEEAGEFFEIMQAYQIIPPGIELSTEGSGGVVAKIPAGIGNPHLIYAALTCYRWVDCHPPLVWQYLYLHRHGIGGAPWRLLPYLIYTHISNQNHSFIQAYDKSYTYCGVGARVHNPLIALGARAYFTQATAKLKQKFNTPGNYVNSDITDYTTTLTPTGNGALASTLRFGVRGPAHLLHPIWDKLLEANPTTQKAAEQFLSQICTEETKETKK